MIYDFDPSVLFDFFLNLCMSIFGVLGLFVINRSSGCVRRVYSLYGLHLATVLFDLSDSANKDENSRVRLCRFI